MTKFLLINMLSAVASAAGFWVGGQFNLYAAVMLCIFGAGYGIYLGYRLNAEYLETDDIAAEVERLRQLGVKILMDVQDNKVCKMAIIEDSEGQKLMLHEIAPERAK